MKPTNKLTHFKNGGNSVLGLPIWLDDAGAEFAQHEGKWVHVNEMPLVRLHTVEQSGQVKPKRTPQFVVPNPPAPDAAAFRSTTPEQQVATKVLKPEWQLK